MGLDGQTLIPSDVSVLGVASLSGSALAGWYEEHAPPGYQATVPISELARIFVEEGAAEGVRGDVAFCQSILETGWFRWPGGSVKPEYNNFAGLGATDTNPLANRFPTAWIGVRAQMQHLRAYAEPDAECGTPCYDVRFDLVQPKGRAPLWNQMGHGNWASSTADYAGRILRMFASILAWRRAQP